MNRKNFIKSATLFVVAFAVIIPSVFASDSQDKTQPEKKSLGLGIDKAFISFRIGIGQSLPDERYHELLDYFDNYKGVTDEITFFTSETHPPIPLDVFKQRIDILEKRMKLARERGYKTGINILSTIGHHNENLENSLKGNYTPMTDIDGKVCLGSFCPNDENLREYIGAIYKKTAQANPDYIWIDDDVRLAGHKPISLTCFCDNCLKIFEKETGKEYTRESLKKAMNEGPVEEKLKLREAWLQHNRNTISRLFVLIEKTVHEVSPFMPIGFMTGDHFYAGYDFENWAKILSGTNNIPVMWRPGGGYYNDFSPSGFIDKAHAIGRQISALPKEVVSIQSEIENFPYQRLRKAANMVAFEAATYIASGCTGAAFNVLSFYDEPLDEYKLLAEKLQNNRPFFDLMAKNLGRTPIVGIQTYWNKNSAIVGNPVTGSWFDSGTPLSSYEVYDIGIPVSYSGKNAAVTILGKDIVYSLSKEEIKKLLSSGVYMTAEALQQLNNLGFSDLTGFEVLGSENKDRIEKLSEHPLNGDFVGRLRDNRQSVWMIPAYTFKKTNEKAQVLSGLIDYTGSIVGDCSMGIFENSLGGRICVAGYYPLTFNDNLSKSSQMKSVFRWLSKDNLPGYISSFHKINLWIREPQNNRIALAFTNSSFDVAKDVTLMLKTEYTTIRVYDMNCKETVLKSSGADGAYQKFIIPFVDPWQVRLIINE